MTPSVKVKFPAKRPDSLSTNEHEVLTVVEMANLLRVSKACVYSLIREGRGFPATRVGNKLRGTRRAVLAWLEQQPIKTDSDSTGPEGI